MRLPKFTAEASLGKTRGHYVLTSGAAAESGRVLPQLHPRPEICAGCYSGWVYVCESGACAWKYTVIGPNGEPIKGDTLLQ